MLPLMKAHQLVRKCFILEKVSSYIYFISFFQSNSSIYSILSAYESLRTEQTVPTATGNTSLAIIWINERSTISIMFAHNDPPRDTVYARHSNFRRRSIGISVTGSQSKTAHLSFSLALSKYSGSRIRYRQIRYVCETDHRLLRGT